MKKPMIDTMKRGPYDELYTPREAVAPLLKHITPPKTIWEPCDHGESNITSELSLAGNFVYTTHPDRGFDFLTDNYDKDIDIIVTNPPYSLKDKFIARCIEYQKPWALLLPLDSFGGIKRGQMFTATGEQLSVIVLNRRPDFTGKAKPWFYVAWFTYGLGLERNLYFEDYKPVK